MSWTGTKPDQPMDHVPGTNFMSLLWFFFLLLCVFCDPLYKKLLGVSLDSAKYRLMIIIH